jgi:hypothetical protein
VTTRYPVATAAAATTEAAFEYLQDRLARRDVVHVLTVDGLDEPDRGLSAAPPTDDPIEMVAPVTTLVSRTP